MKSSHDLDWSPANRIRNPSPTFREFVRQFFTEPQIWGRREYDVTLIERLSGDERTTAFEMILMNVATGREHMIDAAAYLQMEAAVPILTEMLAAATARYQRFTIGRALYVLKALNGDELFEIMLAVMEDGPWDQTLDILSVSYRLFPPQDVRKFVEVGLHRSDFGIRFSALNALIAAFYIERHGGQYTPALGEAILTEQLAASTLGSGVPSRYDEAQHFLGEPVYAEPALFATRLSALAAKYPPAG